MTVMELRWRSLAAMIGLVLAAGCGDSPRGRTFYERNIEPILLQKCAGNTSGCHAVREDDPFAVAAGNLDVTSFENVQKRRDTLTSFGAYPFPLFLIKAVGANKLKLQYGTAFRDIEVQHVGEGIIDVSSDAFFTLQQWLENGATENGLKPATPPRTGEGDCTTAVPAGFNAGAYTSNPGFAAFQSQVQPILTEHGCGAGTCHGAPQSDFFITCGSTTEQLAFNFSQAWAFVTSPPDDSQLLRVPLAVEGGGRGHTGGDQLASTVDADYQALRTWAASMPTLDFPTSTPGRKYFAEQVQPMLVLRGCAFQSCHSPQAANDFKLRSGSVGFFSAVALEKNYELLKHEFMALEFPDARRGRAVAKTILDQDERYTVPGGIPHRGGPVLETPGFPADPSTCTAGMEVQPSAFCTIQEWVRREREALVAAGEATPMNPGNPIQIVYVNRNTGSTTGRLEFDTFQGGADLRIVDTTFGADQQINPVDAGASRSLLGNCAGLTAGTADIQHPDVAHDGNRIVFAGRNTGAEPLSVYVVTADGATCTRLTDPAPDAGGIKIHNFDPAWAPDGSAVVFASTRGKAGPTRSRKRFLPQSDLWRVAVNGTTAAGAPEQMTFLSNSELGPAFMREGRVTMTTEKVSDGFYQLSGRRINWDLTDYHPLLAQRKDSPYVAAGDLTTLSPSVGYSSATDIREGGNGDFLLILGDTQANGAPAVPGAAGALAIFNRSVGSFEANRTTDGFLESLRIVGNPGATGRSGSTAGYRRPASLPDGRIMAAFSGAVGAGTFEIVAVDPRPDAKAPYHTQLITNAGAGSRVDAVLVYKHPPRKLYQNRRQLVFGGDAANDDPDHAVLHMPDAPMVFTMLTGNLRRGRPVADFRAARYLAVYTEGLCPSGACSANANGIYESRTMLGRAELADDGSVRMRLPSKAGVVLELQDAGGASLVRMGEEHQLGPRERTSMGVREELFNAVCGGCHGSISGRELDVAVTPDALTNASRSASAGRLESIGP